MRILSVICVLLWTAQTSAQEPQSADADPIELTGRLVEKPFIMKNGKAGDFNELYLRCSVQDYFIKFCESELDRHNLQDKLGEGITLRVEILDGDWDICPEDPEHAQSRIGKYIIVHGIMEE